MATAVEKTKPSQSPPPPPTSFSSLPHDVVLNCLARVSRSYSPILSLVSKSFRTLMSSPELHATRALIGKTEYVCLDLDNNNSKPHWFTLSQIPKQQKLIPISLTHHKVHNSSSEAAGINSKDCGEVYNPKIQMWEPLSPTVDLDGLKKCVPLNICTVEGDNNCTVEGDNNVRYEISVEKGKLVWRNIVEGWSLVRGLERLSSKSYFPDNLVSVASLGRGGRVAVWWKTVEVGRQGRPYTLQFKTNIWCVEISFEMRPCLHPSGLQFDDELWGFVECDGILDISVYELEHLLRGEMHTVIKDVVTMSPNVINGPVTEQLPEC
ncbi:putative F-box/kelch-repeat protein At3g46050 [Brassica napus]|uniref:putative F-box/kelch-repeat protein At3g46050 n=1 Tax=Brassica napus TaxID=3708 RepID=UPI00207A9140|nr:putative F-box/kelch-repeat protein At3g46050 [Brassica napus]